MKDEHAYGEKMARKGLTKVNYKGTFISKQSLVQGQLYRPAAILMHAHFKGLIGKNLFRVQYPSETHFLPFKFISALKAVKLECVFWQKVGLTLINIVYQMGINNATV